MGSVVELIRKITRGVCRSSSITFKGERQRQNGAEKGIRTCKSGKREGEIPGTEKAIFLKCGRQSLGDSAAQASFAEVFTPTAA